MRSRTSRSPSAATTRAGRPASGATGVALGVALLVGAAAEPVRADRRAPGEPATQGPAPAPDTSRADAPADTAQALGIRAGVSARDTTASRPRREKRIYYGGSFGLSLYGDLLRLYVQPLMGYKINRKVSLGSKALFEYLRDHSTPIEVISYNYGGSVFSRYRLTSTAYTHAEYAFTIYDSPGNRVFVPYLLLGGGYVQPISPNAAVFFEGLVDVLNDKNSPYDAWQPWVSVGVGVGF